MSKICCVCKHSIDHAYDSEEDARFIILQTSYIARWGGTVTGYNATQYVCTACKDDVRREFPDLL